jgi:hypothetical protein
VPYAELADPQSLNLYGYVRNNPLSRADVDGHCDTPLTFVGCLLVVTVGAILITHELHEWAERRKKAEADAFQKSLDCTSSNAQCTEEELRAYDRERLRTYGEGAVKAIENTVPTATPAADVTGFVIDQAKGKIVDKLVDSAKKQGDQQKDQSNQQGQKDQKQQPSVTPPKATPPPPPPPSPQPPPPPPPPPPKKKDGHGD